MITVYYDEYGNLISDLNQIIIGYLTGWFFIDALSSIPVNIMALISGSSKVSVFGLSPSTLKILKIGKTIRGLKVMKKLLQTSAVD